MFDVRIGRNLALYVFCMMNLMVTIPDVDMTLAEFCKDTKNYHLHWVHQMIPLVRECKITNDNSECKRFWCFSPQYQYLYYRDETSQLELPVLGL